MKYATLNCKAITNNIRRMGGLATAGAKAASVNGIRGAESSKPGNEGRKLYSQSLLIANGPSVGSGIATRSDGLC